MRWIVGCLLVGAGVLKAIRLVIEPATALASPLDRLYVPLQIVVELSIGAFAPSNLYWQQLRWLSLVLFSGFAIYSFHLATSGAVSCGCFGPIEINPWWTFGMDAVVVGLLFSQFARTAPSPPAMILQRQLAAALMATVVVGTAALTWHATPSSATSLTAIDGLVVLEPNEWVGKPFPIADFIDANLSNGE